MEEAASDGWWTSGGGFGEGTWGREAPTSEAAAGGARKTGHQGEVKNLEGAMCSVVGFSLVICSSWGKPEKSGGASSRKLSRPSSAQPPTSRLGGCSINIYLLTNLHSNCQGETEPGWSWPSHSLFFAGGTSCQQLSSLPVPFSLHAQGSLLYPHFTKEDIRGLEKCFSSF